MSRKKKRERLKLRIQATDVILELLDTAVQVTVVTAVEDEYARALVDALGKQKQRRVWPPEVFIELEVEKPEGQMVKSPSGGDNSREIPSKQSDEGSDFPYTS